MTPSNTVMRTFLIQVKGQGYGVRFYESERPLFVMWQLYPHHGIGGEVSRRAMNSAQQLSPLIVSSIASIETKSRHECNRRSRRGKAGPVNKQRCCRDKFVVVRQSPRNQRGHEKVRE